MHTKFPISLQINVCASPRPTVQLHRNVDWMISWQRQLICFILFTNVGFTCCRQLYGDLTKAVLDGFA